MAQQKDVCKAGMTAEERDQEDKQSSAQRSGATGLGCTYLSEPIPTFQRAKCEKIYRRADSWLVFGRDRPAGRHVREIGYGPKGHTQSHMIDLVVGRNSAALRCGARSHETPDGFAKSLDPNFETDSARVYISQKSDVDDYFGLVPGKVRNKTGRSCVALKADGIRIMAREGIKIVTGMDKNNSRGEANMGKAGIDLIYGNKENGDDYVLEPMVKGLKLQKLLEIMLDMTLDNTGMIAELSKLLISLGGSYAGHMHVGNVGAPTPGTNQIPDGIKAILEAVKNFTAKCIPMQQKHATNKANALSAFGAEVILSKWHHLN